MMDEPKRLIQHDGKIEEKEKSVYFIQEGKKGNVKIGISANPFRRKGEMQSGNSEKLNMVLIIENANQDLERKLHNFFREYNLRGEWFENDVIGLLKYEIKNEGVFNIYEKEKRKKKIELNPKKDLEEFEQKEKKEREKQKNKKENVTFEDVL